MCVATQDLQLDEEDIDEDEPDEADEVKELEVWTQGWNERVYGDENVPAEITLGEMLLLYFDWMSMHKVRLLDHHSKHMPICFVETM